MVKDVFGIAHIKLTSTNGAILYLNAVDIVTIEGVDEGSTLWLIHGGCDCFVHCTETPEQVIALINELANKQEEFHKQLEEEAKEKAKERFFDAHPAAKEALLKEAEAKKQADKQ